MGVHMCTQKEMMGYMLVIQGQLENYLYYRWMSL